MGRKKKQVRLGGISMDPSPKCIADYDSVGSILNKLKIQDFYDEQMSHVERIPGRRSKTCKLEHQTLPQKLVLQLHNVLNIDSSAFYFHQAKAIDAIRRGQHVVVSTSTSSGKSIIYNVSVIEAIMKDKEITAFYLFPTKALAQDQLRAFNELCGNEIPVSAVICDGDTDANERRRIKCENYGNIIFTNPDMMHYTLLNDHLSWKRLFKKLRFVVIDEAHCYKGAFGTHVSAVLKRLVRVCLYHGSLPQFICCSATIANPLEHMKKLIPLDALAMFQRSTVTKPFGANNSDNNKGTNTSSDNNKGTKIKTEPNSIEENKENATVNNNNSHASKNIDNNSSNNSENNDYEDAIKFRRKPILLSQQSQANNNNNQNASNEVDQSRSYEDIVVIDSTMDGSPNGERYFVIWNPPTDGNDEQQQTMNNMIDDNIDDDYYNEDDEEERDVICIDVDDVSRNNNRNNHNNRHRNCNHTNTNNNNGNNNNNNTNQDNIPAKKRSSSIYEMAYVFTAFVQLRLRTLAFCKYRKLVELVLKYSQSMLEEAQDHFLIDYVGSYRAGYSKDERRAIEADLFNGKLLGVTTTNALELGIDIGSLDITLHLGFPGTFASLWQQAGRAGRSGRASISIMICFDSPIDQYFARNPQVLLKSSVEPAILDVDNIHILTSHLQCAAKEIPLNYNFVKRTTKRSIKNNINNNNNNPYVNANAINIERMSIDSDLWGQNYVPIVKQLIELKKIVPASHDHLRTSNTNDNNTSNNNDSNGKRKLTDEELLEHDAKTVQWKLSREYDNDTIPHEHRIPYSVSLRMIDPITINIIDMRRRQRGNGDNGVIDNVTYSRSMREVFDGAIYMHRGTQYRVEKLDLKLFQALVVAVDVDYFTEAVDESSVEVIKTHDSDESIGHHYGLVNVRSQVTGYWEVDLKTNEHRVLRPLQYPSIEYETFGFWIDVTTDMINQLLYYHFDHISCIHSITHLLLAICPLFAQCDSNDLNAAHSIPITEHNARILLFDERAGGLGACNALFAKRREILVHAYDLVRYCKCSHGCPSCILVSRCNKKNSNLNKRGAIKLLELLLARQNNNPITVLGSRSDVPISLLDDDDDTNTNNNNNNNLRFNVENHNILRKTLDESIECALVHNSNRKKSRK